MKSLTYLKYLSLHTWAGILFGLLIFVLMLSGSVAVFHHELEQWQDPPKHHAHLKAKSRINLHQIVADHMAKTEGEVEQVMIMLPRPNHPMLEVNLNIHNHAEEAKGTENEHQSVHTPLVLQNDGQLVEIADPEPGMAGFFTELHTHLHLPYQVAPYVLGPASLAMFVLLITGVFTHRQLFQKLFNFRLKRGTRVIWTDFHTLLGVWALPFFAVIAITAIPMALHTGPWISWMSIGASGGDTNQMNYFSWFQKAWPEASDKAVPTKNLDTILADAVARDPAFRPARLIVTHPNDANARVIIDGFSERGVTRTSAHVYEGATGKYLGLEPAFEATSSFAGTKLFGLMFSLHFGDFGGFTSRLVWFILGIAGAFIAASGQYIWIAKRLTLHATDVTRRQCQRMTTLTTGVCGGMTFAVAATLALWPLWRAMSDTIVGFGYSGWLFGALWLGALVYAFYTPHKQRANQHLLRGAAICAISAPILRSIVFQDHLFSAIADGRLAVAVMDLIFLGCGLLLFAGMYLKQNLAEESKGVAVKPAKQVPVAPPAIANVNATRTATDSSP